MHETRSVIGGACPKMKRHGDGDGDGDAVPS